jgi:hypothetical protein
LGLATPASDFVQRQPEDGKPATEKTEVRVLSDEKSIYIGISCFDQSPEEIVANQVCWDADLDQNDFVGQTFRFAYLFPALRARRGYRLRNVGTLANQYIKIAPSVLPPLPFPPLFPLPQKD